MMTSYQENAFRVLAICTGIPSICRDLKPHEAHMTPFEWYIMKWYILQMSRPTVGAVCYEVEKVHHPSINSREKFIRAALSPACESHQLITVAKVTRQGTSRVALTDRENTNIYHYLITPFWRHTATKILVNGGSYNGLLPDGTKPLSKPMLTRDYCHPPHCGFTAKRTTCALQNYHSKTISEN